MKRIFVPLMLLLIFSLNYNTIMVSAASSPPQNINELLEQNDENSEQTQTHIQKDGAVIIPVEGYIIPNEVKNQPNTGGKPVPNTSPAKSTNKSTDAVPDENIPETDKPSVNFSISESVDSDLVGNIPKTGDSLNLQLYAIVGLLCLFLLFYLLFKRNKNVIQIIEELKF